MELTREKNLKLHDFKDIVEYLRTMKISLKQDDLEGPFKDPSARAQVDYKLYLTGYQKRCNYLWRPLDIRRVALGQGYFKGFNTGALLWGQ